VHAARRRVARGLGLLALVAMASALSSSSALAQSQRGHVFSSVITGAGACALSEPAGVAVNEATGDLYVANRGNGKVFELGPSGECLGQFETEVPSPQGIAIAPASTGKNDVFVAGTEAVFQFSPKGKLLATKTQFKNPVTKENEEFLAVHGIAMDAKGTLYVYRGEEGVVGLNGATAATNTEAISMACLEEDEVPGLAVGPEGAPLYVSHLASNSLVFDEGECETPPQSVIAKIAPTGAVETEAIEREPTSGVSVDLSGTALGASAKGDVYLDSEKSVVSLDSEGHLIQRFGGGHLAHGAGLAIDSATGVVYVADATKNHVAVFGLEGAGPPQIDAATFKDVSPSSTVLEAQIDPHGAATHFFFQYGSVDCAVGPSECKEVPVPEPGTEIGAGFGDVKESFEVTGLAPGTTYSYRVIAKNEHGEALASQALHTFTTLPGASAGLLDGRGWELVTPPEKLGASVQPIAGTGGSAQPVQAAADGSAIAYATDGPVEPEPEGNRSPEATPVLSKRGSHGWSSGELVTPHELGEGLSGFAQEYRLFSTDLSFAMLEPKPRSLTEVERPPLSPAASERTIYRRDNAVVPCDITQTACYQPLVTGKEPFSNVPPGTHFGAKLTFLDAAPDLQHAIFSSGVPLTAASAPEGGLYEWSGEQPLQLVSVLPNGHVPSEVALGDLRQEGESVVAPNAISSNGARVYWTAESEQLQEGNEHRVEHLYMRDTKTGTSIQVDASQGVPPPKPEEAEKFAKVHYQMASANGSRVFFTDTYPLTPESTLEPIQGGPADLYVCEFPTPESDACTLKDLTPDTHFNESAEVVGRALAASEDGSFVYFVANGVLAPELVTRGAQPGSCSAREKQPETTSGTCYLYVEHFSGGAWEPPRYIATLSQEDQPDWASAEGSLDLLTARASPHGRYLAFMSDRPLTGYDNEDALTPGVRDEEVFVYDFQRQTLTCASCNPSGMPPVGVFDTEHSREGGLLVDRAGAWAAETNLVVAHRLAGSIPGWTELGAHTALYQSRYLNDEGRLFFNAADALVPADKNQLEDVYEYEPAGAGGCHAGSDCVALISSGESDHESAFLDASESGNDAFFMTSQALVGADHDTNFDVYDARVGGSSPSSTPSLSCEEAATCRPVASTPVMFQAPPSAGPGSNNVAPASRVLPVKKRVLTAKEKLAKALSECRHKYRAHRKRATCERAARRRYGTKKPAKHASRRGSIRHDTRGRA
jgi:DNA-binding beta-propeller fold protein YncE